MTNDPHQCTPDAWEANAEVLDSRMGDNGNDFFQVSNQPARVSNQRCMISIDD